MDIRSSVPTASARGGPGGNASAFWHPPGDAVTVAGATVADGMVHVGRASRPGENDASFIDPALPVAKSSEAAGPLGYWPSYGAITPECRRRYLEWLSSGKRDPSADLGYVFLYFYGLERRLLLEDPLAEEVRALVAELERLRTIYSGSRSFEGYSRSLMAAAALLQSAKAAASEPFVPNFAAPAGDIPLALKVAIAREVVAGRPLGFELAAAALFGLRDFTSGYANRRGKRIDAWPEAHEIALAAQQRSGIEGGFPGSGLVSALGQDLGKLHPHAGLAGSRSDPGNRGERGIGSAGMVFRRPVEVVWRRLVRPGATYRCTEKGRYERKGPKGSHIVWLG